MICSALVLLFVLHRLLQLCQRTMALPVGRGLFTLFSYHPVPTEPLPVPKLNLTGNLAGWLCWHTKRVQVFQSFYSIQTTPFLSLHLGRAPPRNTTVDLNSGNIDVPPNMTSWPSFHNGVAAGLKIAPASQVGQFLYCFLIMSHSQICVLKTATNEYFCCRLICAIFDQLID